jgi:hypothetical protein
MEVPLNPYRWLFINASYQVSVHWGRQVQRRRLIEIDQSKTRNIINVYTPLSLHLTLEIT